MATLYSPKIVTDGLVLALDAANRDSYPGSGTVWTDLSGNGNNGTLTNGPTFSSGNIGGLVFDGVDDYINIATSVSIGNPNTVCAMIKLSGSNGDTSIYGPNANGQDNWLGINGNKVFLYSCQTSDVNEFSLIGTTTLDSANNIWYFVTSTISDNIASIYLNGVQENTTTKAFTIGSWAGTSAVGRRGLVNQRYFKGSIAYLMGYNRALTAAEVLQNYNATKGRFGL